MEKLNVAIADDNERMLRELGDIVRSDEELQVVGTAKDGEEAYEMIKKKEPDVVLLDIVMPKLDGLTVMDKIKNDKNMKKHPAFINRAGKNHGRRIFIGSRLLHYETV